MSQPLELTKKNSDDLIRKYADVAYRNSKVFSIKEGALISKCFRILNGQDKDENLTDKKVYEILFKVLETGNNIGAFSFDDAAIIDVVMDNIRSGFNSSPPDELSEKEKDDNVKEV